MLARSIAKRVVQSGIGEEVLVTLEYTPECDRPSGVTVVVDGRIFDNGVLAKVGNRQLENHAVWREWADFGGSLVELARWGHQVEGVPWEAVGVLV